jgi:choline transport protein
MAEEIRGANVVIPWCMVSTTLLNGILSLCSLLPWTLKLSSKAPQGNWGFPLLIQIFYDATGSLSGASAMICIIIIMDIAAAIAFLATSSRIVWAFGRDRGLPFWRTMSKVCGFPSLKVFATELTRHYRSSQTRLFPSTQSGSWLASPAPSV